MTGRNPGDFIRLFQSNSMLFCSDIKYDMNDYLLGTYRNDISCDYIQAGHHGNWSFSDEFYEAAGASYAFIDAPSSITDNPDFPASTLKSSLQNNILFCAPLILNSKEALF